MERPPWVPRIPKPRKRKKGKRELAREAAAAAEAEKAAMLAAIPNLTTREDLGIMHLFTAKTSRTISSTSEQAYVWQCTIPEMAFTNLPLNLPLLHGVLALGAWQRAMETRADLLRPGGKEYRDMKEMEVAEKEAQETRRDLKLRACRYAQVCLNEHVQKQRTVTEENCHLVFAYSMTLSTLCFAMVDYNARESNTYSGTIFALVSAARVLHGSLSLTFQFGTTLAFGPLAALLELRLRAGGTLDIPQEWREALTSLKAGMLANHMYIPT